MLEQLLANSVELELDVESDQYSAQLEMYTENMLKAASAEPPPVPGHGYGPIPHQEEAEGALEAKEPRTYVYDEWGLPGRRLQTPVVHRAREVHGRGRPAVLQRYPPELRKPCGKDTAPVRNDHARDVPED